MLVTFTLNESDIEAAIAKYVESMGYSVEGASVKFEAGKGKEKSSAMITMGHKVDGIPAQRPAKRNLENFKATEKATPKPPAEKKEIVMPKEEKSPEPRVDAPVSDVAEPTKEVEPPKEEPAAEEKHVETPPADEPIGDTPVKSPMDLFSKKDTLTENPVSAPGPKTPNALFAKKDGPIGETDVLEDPNEPVKEAASAPTANIIFGATQ